MLRALGLEAESELESDEADKTTRVNVETLQEFSERTPEGKDQRIVLRFLASPIELKGDGKVESIVIGKNELVERMNAKRIGLSGRRDIAANSGHHLLHRAFG